MIKLFNVLAVIALLLTAVHVVAYDFTLFAKYPFVHVLMEGISKTGLASNHLLCKLLIVAMTSIGGWGMNLMRQINVVKVLSVFVLVSCVFVLLHFIVAPGYLYSCLQILLFIVLYVASTLLGSYLKMGALENERNKPVQVSFMQERKLVENPDSVNMPSRFMYEGKVYDGWINVVNPFRGSLVVGLPGSGKTYTFFYHYIEQMIEKGYCGFCYDFKFDELSEIVYNVLIRNVNSYEVKPKFYVINLDNPRRSNRCNPLNPAFLTDIIDAYEAAYMVMINLNKSWVKKQGDFFIESAIVFFTAIIWYLKLYEDGKYCTLPHAIELLMRPYEAVFTMLQQNKDVKNYMAPFINAMEGGANEQLQGQIASGQIPLARLSSPAIYWALSGDDFTLDINNPKEPKIVCLGNNPDRQNIYAAALSLYISRMFKVINRPGRQKCFVMLDELPTIYIKGLDNLIATARSNKVAIIAGAQDYSQIIRDYGQAEADVIINTIGNLFSGQVKGKTAKMLSETFGKINKQKKSITHHDKDSTNNLNVSMQLEDMIPSSVVSTLSQGTFVGQVADNYSQTIQQKFFHSEVKPNRSVTEQMKAYESIPQLADCSDGELDKIVRETYERIKGEIDGIISKYL